MAGPSNSRDQPSMHPNDNYGHSNPTRYESSFYHNTEMTANAPTDYLPAFAQQVQAMTDTKSQSNGSGTVPSGMDPAMAPPQTPNHHLPQSSNHSSMDMDSAAQSGDKRKRSKASRACDECRRKKIKCDADPDNGGPIQTCTNCRKVDAVCEFERKPMKRGPSKGYITALAARVQGLEQQHRQSFDGYADMSPDQMSGPSLNRTFSLTGPSISPFPSSEYARDRIPSTGWLPFATSASTRPRTLGSLALAPNETLPAVQAEQFQDLSRSLAVDINPRPAKRLRPQGSSEDSRSLEINEATMDKYYGQYNSHLGLLPVADKVLSVVAEVKPDYRGAFVTALQLLPDVRGNQLLNGGHEASVGVNADPTLSTNISLVQFKDYKALEVFIKQETTVDPDERTEAQNLTLAWTLLLLAISLENNVERLEGGALSKSRLLLITHFILNYLRSDHQAPQIQRSSHEVRIGTLKFAEEVQQAYCCACLMTKYHALSLGKPAIALAPEGLSNVVSEIDAKKLPPAAAHLSASSNVLDVISEMVLPGEMSIQARCVIKSAAITVFNSYFANYEASLRDSSLLKQVHRFVMLCAATYEPTLPMIPTNLLSHADHLVTVLIEDARATIHTSHYNPIDMYTWSLAALIFCEFQTDVSSKPLADFATSRLKDLRAELEKKSIVFHENYAHKAFFGGKMQHWSDAVMAMIDYVSARPRAADEERGDDAVVVPRFAEHMERGWMQAVLFFVKKE